MGEAPAREDTSAALRHANERGARFRPRRESEYESEHEIFLATSKQLGSQDFAQPTGAQAPD